MSYSTGQHNAGSTAREAAEEFGPGAVVGLLATDGTLRTRLYHEALDRVGLIGVAPPTPGVQHAVMDALDTVKLHGVSEEVSRAMALGVKDLAENGAAALIVAGSPAKTAS